MKGTTLLGTPTKTNRCHSGDSQGELINIINVFEIYQLYEFRAAFANYWHASLLKRYQAERVPYLKGETERELVS